MIMMGPMLSNSLMIDDPNGGATIGEILFKALN